MNSATKRQGDQVRRGFVESAATVLQRCEELGEISDDPDCLTRTFHSPAMQRANSLVSEWMRLAGMEVREDPAFNLIGRFPSANPRAKTLLVGSHLDTVRNAGKYDGPLGVLLGIACVELLKQAGIGLPFHVEVIGFSDEEGVRYQTTYLGSRAIAGTLTRRDLDIVEEKGIEKARRKPSEFLGYIEAHIEQGPVLEAKKLSLGVVTAIAGQSRIGVEFAGRAGHAGTTPMDLRQDALCAAAELILAVESCGVIATVGMIEVEPGASNVIPAHAAMTLDVRHQSDRLREKAVGKLRTAATAIARKRRVRLTWKPVQETRTVPCDPNLTALLGEAVVEHERELLLLPSGAGHDAAAIAALCPISMLFVRCKGGISHHPDEAVTLRDVAAAIRALFSFIIRLKERHE